MNDRFKFRVYDGKKMHYDDFVVTATGYIASIDDYDEEYCVFDQSDFTADRECKLMQCTGLKDKNGVLIYEGDICQIPNFSDSLFSIYFKEKDACFYAWYQEGGASLTFSDEFEVIGNIYENPELLEEKQ